MAWSASFVEFPRVLPRLVGAALPVVAYQLLLFRRGVASATARFSVRCFTTRLFNGAVGSLISHVGARGASHRLGATQPCGGPGAALDGTGACVMCLCPWAVVW